MTREEFVDRLIGQSVRETRIVFVPIDESAERRAWAHEGLAVLCEDYVRVVKDRGLVEYWGTRPEDGAQWRVHVAVPRLAGPKDEP